MRQRKGGIVTTSAAGAVGVHDVSDPPTECFSDTSLAIPIWKTSHCPCFATMEVVT